jgi:hypothetical protein
MLRDAAARRYPEHWKTYQAELNIDMLDELYAQFRNLAAMNFPVEEHDRARCFGTFLGDAYTPTMVERIEELGGQSPWVLLGDRNQSFAKFDLDHERSTARFP